MVTRTNQESDASENGNSKYADLLKKREKEVKELQGQVKSLTSRLEHHVKTATIDEDNKAGIVQLRTQIGTLTANNVALNVAFEKKKRIVEQLEIQLIQHKEKVKELEDQKDDLIAERNELENKLLFKESVTPRSLHEAMFEAGNLSFEPFSEKSKLPLEIENKRLAAHIKELKALEPLKGEIITIKSQNRLLEKEHSIVTKQKKELERQVAELNEKLTKNQQHANKDVVELKVQLKKANVAIERMREAETRAETKLTEMEKLLQLRTSERDNCKVLLSKCKQDKEDKTQSIERPSKIEKKFVLKAVFDDVLSLSEEYRFSADEEHFGALWSFIILRKNDCFHLYLKCSVPGADKYSVKCQRVFKLKTINGFSSFEKVSSSHSDYEPAFGSSIKWDLFKNHFVIDGKCHVEADIEINKVTGVNKKSYETFDETSFSDVALVVQNKKFHVFELFLASRSRYFKTLFEKRSPDSEIVINDVESEDFHVLLGVLYGGPLDESTVEIAWLMAEHFDAEVVTRRCEHFLIKTSRKILKKTLQMAVRYKLDNLAKICVDAI